MRLSTLIKNLKNVLETEGDLEVTRKDGQSFSFVDLVEDGGGVRATIEMEDDETEEAA